MIDFTTDARDRLDGTLMVTGGHFMIAEDGPVLNDGTVQSFRSAVDAVITARLQKRPSILGVLINDIGAACSADHCAVGAAVNRDGFILPHRYRQILSDASISTDTVQIFWEKHLRNRGKKLFNHLRRESRGEVRAAVDGYVFRGSEKGGDIVLTRINGADQYGTPACPLIMCAFAAEQRRLGAIHSVNFYYVGDDNSTNIPNYFVIEKGTFLAAQLGISPVMRNVYQFDDGSTRVLRGEP